MKFTFKLKQNIGFCIAIVFVLKKISSYITLLNIKIETIGYEDFEPGHKRAFTL